MEQITLSVSDLISLVNQTLEYAYPSVAVEGEVASFKVSKGKYVFFDLKDDDGVVGCFMTVYQLRLAFEDGMRVRVVAQPRLTPWGKFSLTVREAAPVGAGSIKRSFELLRAKLADEGLFDESRKRALPLMPTRVGLIASIESAGYADFIKIVNSRWGGMAIQVAGVLVQGPNAGNQIIQALQHFNEGLDPVEVIVIVRGGGSAEDLATFNDELLVRAIAASRTPTLVGVGHEVDTSLSDLAADVRAATPSNAAQLLVPDRGAIAQGVGHHKTQMIAIMERHIRTTRRQTMSGVEHMLGRIEAQLTRRQRHVQSASQVLRQCDPRLAFRRGYALVRNQQGGIVKSSDDVLVGDQIIIETHTALIQSGVTHVQNKG